MGGNNKDNKETEVKVGWRAGNKIVVCDLGEKTWVEIKDGVILVDYRCIED
jgi:hypothetical protein